MKNINKIRGCIIGGAVGDALGYPVEFLRDTAIFSRYGKDGITEYSLHRGKALISDDTQMTLFTAAGLVLADSLKTDDYAGCIYKCYRDWCKMQIGETTLGDEKHCWLGDVPELSYSRAPGITCIGVLTHHAVGGTVSEPINDSKGCGGIMRVAPVGLYFNEDKPIREIALLGAETAALTHGNELGYIPSAMLAYIIHRLANEPDAVLADVIKASIEYAKMLFANCEFIDCMVRLAEKAIELSHSDISDLDAIRQLGQGWVAEETFAIAVYCSLKYENDFEKAVIASVNHSGDSDSTGAVTGNIMGVYLGFDAIPKKFIDNLEIFDVILMCADALAV